MGRNVMSEAEDNGSAKQTRAKRFRIFAGIVAVAAVGGGAYWLLTHNHETTDDAFIQADVIELAPQVSGPVAALHVTDNQFVEAGQPILEIDPRDYAVAVDLARANVDSAQADLEVTKASSGATLDAAGHAVTEASELVDEAARQAEALAAESQRAQADVKRYDELLKSTFASHQRYEQALSDARSASARWKASQSAADASRAALAQARAKLADAQAAPLRVAQKQAQLEQAKANLAQAELNLSYTRIAAPRAGRITRRAVRQGDLVQKDETLAYLVTAPPWVEANFKETQLTRMKPGQPVAVRVDAYPDHVFAAHLDSIQAGSGSRFALLPAENATGNYVKVVQRVPVKILFDDPADPLLKKLSPGLSVVPDVDVGGPGTAAGPGATGGSGATSGSGAK